MSTLLCGSSVVAVATHASYEANRCLSVCCCISGTPQSCSYPLAVLVGTFLDVAGTTPKADNAGVVRVRHSAAGLLGISVTEQSNRYRQSEKRG